MSNSTPTKLNHLRTAIEQDALSQGFDAVGFASADAPPQQGEHLTAFINSGFMGDMHWLAETATRRASPQAMWPEAKTAIILAVNYAPDHDPMDSITRTDSGNISVYARGRDYHQVIKGRLKQIAARIAAREGVAAKVFVDTAPLMEKPLAARGGLGWQGKHTNLVSRDYGSWLFLGVILVDADWLGGAAVEGAVGDHCGSCTKCLDICPTKAFPAPYQLDARRCISYLTIEHKGMIPREFRTAIGNRIFGCDDCLAICPWNSFATEAQEIKLKAMAGMSCPDLAELLALDDARFRQKFAGTPVRRAGYERFMRNVLIAVGNSNNPLYINSLIDKIDSEHELIKAASIWALSRLMTDEAFRVVRADHQSEKDSPVVAAEWNMEDVR
jgi:epoxyqueuosine reductase